MPRLAAILILFSLPAPAAAQGNHDLDYTDITGAVATLALDGGNTEVEMADVNADGCPDLVSVGDHGSPFINTQQHGVTVWLGDCAGGWALVQTGDFGYGGVAVGDVDGDGHADVGYGVHHDYSGNDLGDQLLEVALGDGTGAAWTPWDDGLATGGETWGMFGTDFGDVDGDGDLDLGSNSFGCCAGVHVYLNQGDGTWVQSFGFLGGNAGPSFEFADVDGDGHLDAISSNSLGRVWRGDGQGGFALADGNLPGSWLSTAAGDLDGDGRDEVVTVQSSQALVHSWSPGNVWIDRTGDLASVWSPAQEVDLVDMDMDGDVDLLAVGSGRLGVYSTDGLGQWTRTWVGLTPGGGSPQGVSVRSGADLDHNGFPDVSLIQDEPRGLFNSINRHYVFAEASTPTDLDIRPLSPGPKRVWRGGQERFIEWTSAVPAGDLGTVTILLSTTGGSGPYTFLATGVPNGGRTQVTVPTGISSSACRLIYVVTTNAPERRRATGPAFTILP